MCKSIFFVFFAICLLEIGQAQDRVFARTYQSNVIPKGGFDLEYIATLRSGKSDAESPYALGRYFDARWELEFGLGKNWQTAFYYNTSDFSFRLKDSVGGAGAEQRVFKTSFSNEWKWKLSDPVANRLGSALYFELTAAPDEYEFETKFILDKRYLNDLIAFNITAELEFETELKWNGLELEKEIELEYPFELNLGYMHFLKPELGIGIELRHHGKFEHGELEYAALFGGPSVYFNQGRFFGVLNVLPQWANMHKTEELKANIDRVHHEALETRLLIGYSF